MAETEISSKTPYRVLARKYRPQHFDDLIGQEVLVRTLKNAIEGGRIAHAFMLTGIRGVGKTTTARIIAKALNYTGPDGKSGPTTGPTGDCPVCQAISGDRHPDIMEMDAASRTGVGDIREILEGVRYAPVSARYKIYIIDEVHMLSTSAFNALLKTLEEPPEHVKFIFATTEIRKVPVTVLSRCQRFDLRRVEAGVLRDHYRKICELEQVGIEEEALSMIARAAGGSVRDGLSLLDQAMALSNGKITAAQVTDMLGLADRSQTLSLLEKTLSGKIDEALAIADALYRSGADPVVLIQDLLEYVHLLSRLRAVPGAPAGRFNMDSESFAGISAMAASLPVPVLGRAWQILIKGLGELGSAPDPQAAAEMLLIRLAYSADLPDPAELVRKIRQSGENSFTAAPAASEASRGSLPASSSMVSSRQSSTAAAAPARETETIAQAAIHPQSMEDIVAILQDAGEHLLAGQVYHFVHPVKIAPGQLQIAVEPEAPAALAHNLGAALGKACGRRWVVLVATSEKGTPTLAELERSANESKLEEVRRLPLVQEIFSLFPGAEIVKIHRKTREDDSR